MPMVKKIWMYKPPKSSAPKVSDLTKASISAKAAKLIDNLKPKHIRDPDPGNDFNYLVDIFGNWHGRYFYFCSKYNSPAANALSPSFELKFARIECAGSDSFNLSYMRHTGQWIEVFQGLTLDQCLDEIGNNPIFTP